MKKLLVLLFSFPLFMNTAATAYGSDVYSSVSGADVSVKRVDTLIFDNNLSKNTATKIEPSRSHRADRGSGCTAATCNATNVGTTFDFDPHSGLQLDYARLDCPIVLSTGAYNWFSPGPYAIVSVTWTITKPSGAIDVLTSRTEFVYWYSLEDYLEAYIPDEVGTYLVDTEVTTDCTDECPLDNFSSTSFDTYAIAVDLHTSCGTAITKSKIDFTVLYTNLTCSAIGDDETVIPQLRALLFANGKIAGDFSTLLDAIPVLEAGATWHDTSSATVPPTYKSKKVQQILRVPMRTEVRVKIDGLVDPAGTDYVAFRIEEKGTGGNDTAGGVGPSDYWMIDNDEGHDINPADGFGGASAPGTEIGYIDGVFGNEGFWAQNLPNHSNDAWGVYAAPAPNVGSNFFLTQVDVGIADLGAVSGATPSEIGIFRDIGNGKPDLTNPIYGPTTFTPLPANSISGGDHGQSFTISPAAVVAPCEPVWTVYFFGGGRQDGWALDNPNGLKTGPGAVDFGHSAGSGNNFQESDPIPGNLIVGYRVSDPAGAAPSSGETLSESFGDWKSTVLRSALKNR